MHWNIRGRMADKDTAVGKGDAAEKAFDRKMIGEGWKVVIKSTRSMVKIPNPNPALTQTL